MRHIWHIFLAVTSIVVLLGSLVCNAGTGGQAAEAAKQYIGVKEQGNNAGPEVERFLSAVGLPKGNSWCMSFVAYNYLSVGYPWYRSGRCSAVWDYAKSHELTYKVFTSDEVASGSIKLQPGDVPIWRHGTPGIKNFNGHTGITQYQLTPTRFVDVEGNTSSGVGGNQSNGDGVYQRARSMGFGTTFRIEGFIRVREKERK